MAPVQGAHQVDAHSLHLQAMLISQCENDHRVTVASQLGLEILEKNRRVQKENQQLREAVEKMVSYYTFAKIM